MISARERRIQIEASLAHEQSTLSQIKLSMAQADQATLAMSRYKLYRILDVLVVLKGN